MAISPEKSGQPKFSLPAIAVSPQILLLLLGRPPQSLDKDVVKPSPSAKLVDLDLVCLQTLHKVAGSELSAFI